MDVVLVGELSSSEWVIDYIMSEHLGTEVVVSVCWLMSEYIDSQVSSSSSSSILWFAHQLCHHFIHFS
jgi:hypothetical protein